MTDLLKREDALIAFDVVCRYRTPHVSTLEKGIRTLPAAEAEVESDVLLDAKTKAADMIPLSELLSGDTPLSKWEAHAGVRDIASFGKWLAMKHREYMRMRVAYELGDKDKADELYEWVLAHTAAYGEVAANFRAALSPKDATTPCCDIGTQTDRHGTVLMSSLYA